MENNTNYDVCAFMAIAEVRKFLNISQSAAYQPLSEKTSLYAVLVETSESLVMHSLHGSIPEPMFLPL